MRNHGQDLANAGTNRSKWLGFLDNLGELINTSIYKRIQVVLVVLSVPNVSQRTITKRSVSVTGQPVQPNLISNSQFEFNNSKRFVRYFQNETFT